MGKWWRRIILTVGHGGEPGVALREWELALTHGTAHLSKGGCGASADSSTESRGDGRSQRIVEVELRRNTSKLSFGTLRSWEEVGKRIHFLPTFSQLQIDSSEKLGKELGKLIRMSAVRYRSNLSSPDSSAAPPRCFFRARKRSARPGHPEPRLGGIQVEFPNASKIEVLAGLPEIVVVLHRKPTFWTSP